MVVDTIVILIHIRPMPLPSTASPGFQALTAVYQTMAIEFQHLKAITLAQWALESGWGKTGLASKYNNYAGMKYRATDHPGGVPVLYTAHDGREHYTHFRTHADFIAGYWHRLDTIPLYKDWREHAHDPKAFILFIAPRWRNGRTVLESTARGYARDILGIAEKRTADLFPQAQESP